ncbi:DNA-binding protein [Kosakonia sacchari]|uniref:DNA-binding protein n=1 Tax=Kosakonia sacchari TaxID=1158459 RepID=UPI0032D981B1
MKEEKFPTFSEAIKDIGVMAIASACGCSPRAIYKWMEKGALPRTDFTGETDYAGQIADVSGGKYSAELIKLISRPQKPSETSPQAKPQNQGVNRG